MSSEKKVNSRSSTRRHTFAFGLAPIVASLFVYAGILEHFFWKDDFYHLYDLNNAGALKFVFRPFFSHLLMTWKSVMVATHSIFDLDSRAYFMSILVAHSVNVALVYAIGAVLSRASIASITAGLWGMCPLLMPTLGWYSVFGQVLATTFVLWLLLDLARLSRDGESPSRGALVRWCVLLVATTTSFGIGMAVVMVFGLIVALFLPNLRDRVRLGLAFGSSMFIVPILYLAFQWTYTQLGGEINRALSRDLLGGEFLRSLAILLSLWCYGFSAVALGPLLAGSARRGLNVVGFGPLNGLGADSVLTISCALGLVATLWILWSLKQLAAEKRRAALALLVVTFSAYGIVSIGRAGAGFYDSVAKAALEGRYHYLATSTIPPLLALLFGRMIPRVSCGWRSRVVGAASALLVVATYSAAVSAVDPGDPGREPFRKVRALFQETFERAAPKSTIRFVNENLGPFVIPRVPGLVAMFVIIYPENSVDGKRIYFTEKGASTYRNLRQQTGRVAALIDPDE